MIVFNTMVLYVFLKGIRICCMISHLLKRLSCNCNSWFNLENDEEGDEIEEEH